MPAVNRSAPNSNHTQSVLFAKDEYSKEQCRDWLEEHSYYTDGYDEGESYHRWRQYDPNGDKYYYRQREIKKGLILLFGFLK